MLSPADDALLNDLLDGRLAPGETQAAYARLAREPALREALDELERGRDLLRGLPTPEPPVDFVARVRARLDAEAPSASGAPPAPLRALPGAAPSASTRAPEPLLPPAWRRVVVAAYALAAVLVVGIGVVTMRLRPDAEPARTELAGVPAGDRGAEPGSLREPPVEDGLKTLDGEAPRAAIRIEGTVERQRQLEAAAAREQRALPPAAEAPPPGGVAEPSAPPMGPPAPRAPDASGAEKKDAAPSAAPRFAGPSGEVPRGLRKPSDEAPAVGRPAPAAAAPAPKAAPEPPASTLVTDVYVLEAESADQGRRLLEQVLSGPRAPAPTAPTEAKDAPSEERERGGSAGSGATVVRVRRAELTRDAALLARVGGSPPASGPTPAPVLLADVSRAVTSEQLARLEALVGPRPAQAPTGGSAPAREAAPDGDDKAPADAGAPAPPRGASRAVRLVRVLVVTPPK